MRATADAGAEAARIGRSLTAVAGWVTDIHVVLNAEVADGTVSVAGAFNDWGKAVDMERWTLRPVCVAGAEGFELSVSRPRVVLRKDEASGDWQEPIEEVVIDVDEEHSGVVVQKLSERRADMMDMPSSGAGRQRENGTVSMRTQGAVGFVLDYSNPFGQTFVQTGGASVYDAGSYRPFVTAAASAARSPSRRRSSSRTSPTPRARSSCAARASSKSFKASSRSVRRPCLRAHRKSRFRDSSNRPSRVV